MVVREVLRFTLAHWLHFLLLLGLGVVGITSLHELAHAVAVWVQGGELLDFRVLHDGTSWGHVQYRFPEGVAYNARLISAAPAIAALGAFGLGSLVAVVSKPGDGHVPRAVFFWLCLMPVGELGFMGLGYFTVGARCDLWYALGPISWTLRCLGGLMACCVVALLYGIQRRLFEDLALGPGAFALLGTVAFVGLVAVMLL